MSGKRMLTQMSYSSNGGYGSFGYVGYVSGRILPKIVAITGVTDSKKTEYCGKQLISNYLQNKYLYKKIKLCDPLQDVVKVIFGYEQSKIIKEHFANALISRLQYDKNRYLITDLSNMSEYKILKNMNTCVIRIDNKHYKYYADECHHIPYDMFIAFDGKESSIPRLIRQFDEKFSHIY